MDESKPLVDVKCIKDDAVITVDIPAAMHYRLQTLLLAGIVFKDAETAAKTLHTIKNSDSDPDPQTYHTRTLIWMIGAIEEAAEKQGKLEIKQAERKS